MIRVSDLKVKVEVGTLFTHVAEGNQYKYEVTSIQLGDEDHNDQITLNTIAAPGLEVDPVPTFTVEPAWFVSRKIKLANKKAA